MQLKKHDKRTALTASLGFPRLIGSDASNQLSTELISRAADGGASKPVLTLPGFPSLPHILLSTFTSTLLPIIPSIEDYECLICGDLAFKPIRLNCGHRFCGQSLPLPCVATWELTGESLRSSLLGQDAEAGSGQLPAMPERRCSACQCRSVLRI